MTQRTCMAIARCGLLGICSWVIGFAMVGLKDGPRRDAYFNAIVDIQIISHTMPDPKTARPMGEERGMSQCPSCDSLKTLHTSDEEIVCMGCAYVGPLDLCDSEDDPLESWKCSCCQEVYLVRNSTVCTNPECDLASESTQRERGEDRDSPRGGSRVR